MTRNASVRKRGRVAPTSAMICGAESTPRPGTSAQALHRVVVGREQVGHLRIELAEMVFDHPQFFQNEQGGRQSAEDAGALRVSRWRFGSPAPRKRQRPAQLTSALVDEVNGCWRRKV